MRRRIHYVAVLIAVWSMLGPAAESARAYIDPGTGANLFSSLGVLLGVMGTAIAIGYVQIKRFFSWLWLLISTRRTKQRADNEGVEA